MTSNNLPPSFPAPVSGQVQVPPHLSPPVRPLAIEVKTQKPDSHPPRNNMRELVETVVFVTILVLLLKSFVAEAFVIPTGSMAETLLGYRAFVTCPDCGHEFPINVSEEIEPRQGPPQHVKGATCPNCRNHIVRTPDDRWIRNPVFFWNCGDRVLVAKWPFQEFNRWDVVVFKYPSKPVEQTVPMNYIKRLTGMPGETIAILEGDLYAAEVPIDYSEQHQPTREEDRWHKEFMFVNSNNAQTAFQNGKFRILRKPPPQIMEMRRLVFDNDQQASSLIGVVEPRWQGDAGWTSNDQRKPTSFQSNSDGEHWLRYRHLVVNHGGGQPTPIGPFEPSYITNVMGYNSVDGRVGMNEEGKHWVGDLMLECTVDVTQSKGEFIIELSKSNERFQAVFNLADGQCRLVRVGRVSSKVVATAPTPMSRPGKYNLRFANFDQRLTVWVDNKLIFGDGAEYDGERGKGPQEVNDLQPASVGATGGAKVTVSALKLWRDTYYTFPQDHNRRRAAGEADMTMYIQPGHYLCMGDNSTQSSDGREWGAVPERLMLGRAVMVYFPVWPFAQRFGPIR